MESTLVYFLDYGAIYNKKMFVYLTICKVNGKKYIGKYEGRETDNYLGSGKLLKRAVKKYGEDKFERMILERYSSAEECREGEKKWIERFEATTSKSFYNIAAGGEGGNTFAGIQGEDRIKLIAKLKQRKRPEKKLGTLLCFDVRKGVRIRVTLDEFYKNKYLLGNSCKGIYKTPKGIFTSAKLAGKYHDGLDYTSLSKRCKNPEKKVTKAHITWDRRMKKEDYGKTFKELGYGFIPLESITVEFLNKSKIIKQ